MEHRRAVLDFDDTPGYLIRLAQQRHTQLWTDEFGGDLTGPQYAVISSAWRAGGATQGTVGELASLDKSSTTDVVARLVGQGWLVLSADPHDRRRKHVGLTPLARTALPEVTRRAALVQERLVAPLPDEARDAFLGLMQRVAYAGAVPAPVGEEPLGVLLLHTAPGHLIRRTQQVHTTAWGAELGTTLTAPQYAVLTALWPHPDGVDQSTAGRVAAVDKSTMADIVARLVRRGWISRSRDPRDVRLRRLRLTDSVRAELPTITAAVWRVQERLLTPLPDPEQRATFVAGYRALAYAEDPAAAELRTR